MRRSLCAAMVALLALAWGCSEGTVKFGGDTDQEENPVIVTGNIDDVTPVNTRDIVVFVFTDLTDDDDGVVDFKPFADAEAVVVESGSSEFTIDDVQNGALTVVFLLDNAGDAADGEINDGDQVAVLADDDGRLDDVRAGTTVTIDDVDIDFAAFPPAAEGAIADEITKKTTL